MVKEMNKNQKLETSSASVASASNLLFNQQNTNIDLNYQQQQQQQNLLATVLMFPSLFMTQQPNTATNDSNFQQTANNSTSYLNDQLLATLAGTLMQQQKSQQQQANDMNLSNNAWAKLLTDMSSSLITPNQIQQQQQQTSSTMILANNGEVSLKPPVKKAQQTQSKPVSNAQNGDKLKVNKTVVLNGSNQEMISNKKPINNQSNNSSFSIKDIINNNKPIVHHNQQTSSHKTNQSNNKPNIVNKSKSNISQLGNQTDLNKQNEALMMYAALLQNSSTTNDNQLQSNPFSFFQNTQSTQNTNSFDWLFQLAQGQQQQQIPVSNQSINSQKMNKNSKQQTTNKKNDTLSMLSIDSMIATDSNTSKKSSHSNDNSNSKFKNNFISNMEDQNSEPIEAKIKVPLRYGWRRETIIKEVHRNGIKGDVIYYSPCSKKLRTFQEIERYLSRNVKELEDKGIRLTRENFTFSSKLIVGKFLQLKQDEFEINKTSDEHSRERPDNDLKFTILNEEEVISLISSINPKFRHKNQSETSSNQDNIHLIDTNQSSNGHQQHHQISPNDYDTTYNDLELKHKIESLKLLKQEQETQSRNQQAQMLEMQRLEQQQLEQQLKLKFQTNEMNLQIDLKQKQHQEQIQNRLIQQEKQNQLKNDLIEAKRREKYLHRERKTREKWFEHIITREQQTSKQQQLIDTGVDKPQLIFDSIDDMQERYLKRMPDFKPLHDTEPINDQEEDKESNRINWLGDCLQVIEFITTFSTKLNESLNKNKAETTETTEMLQFSTILNNLESFRSGLENKNDKLKREISHLVQLLLKCAINTISDKNLNLNNLNKSTDFKEDEYINIEDDKQELDRSAVKLTDEDDYYYVKRIKQLEVNDTTYSELLRLYIKRSYYHLKKRRELTANKFNIDVTLDLFESLRLYLNSLELKTFDQLDTAVKASIMAWLCDELLSSSSINDTNEAISQDEYRLTSCIVQDLDQTIEELNELKHEKWQLESKIRQTKTEKLTASVNLSKILKEETKPEQETFQQKEKQQKLVQQIDKKLTQIDKKRIQVKQSHDKCLNKLRSGIHLGQDRYLRHYWSLNHIGGVLIEATSRASIGSIYLSDDSVQLDPNIKEEFKLEAEDQEEEFTIKNYSHLIERISNDDPFKFVLKFNDDQIVNLTFRHIEYLVRNQIQQKKADKIDKKYLNNHTDCHPVAKNQSFKWWLCDNELIFKQLIDCLAKRGYREKLLAKCLSKLNEDNFTNSNSSVVLTDTNGELTLNDSSLFNRISNNLGNLQMFERMQSFFREFTTQNEPNNQRSLNHLKQQEYRDRTKVLKQLYALEDRVFKANLQQPMDKNSQPQNNDPNESPLDIAKNRLLELEARIERRYLKYPFAPRKKLTNIKINNSNQPQEVELDNELDETKEENVEELPTLLSLSAEPTQRKQKPIEVPIELERWRRLVKNCKTSSQLAILLNEFNKLLEWEKSIMKVICQICNCDDNEDKLLLCDNCDKGNHTYCFKPVLDQIPEGDWYCFVCIGKRNTENICCVCGSSEQFSPYSENEYTTTTTDLNKCEKCSKSFHGKCMPYARYFKTSHKWHCLNCQNIKPPISASEQHDSLSNNSNNKRNLSAIHNLNKISANKKRKTTDSAINEMSNNSDDCSNSAPNTDNSTSNKRTKKFKKNKQTTVKQRDDKKKNKKEIENNENECEQEETEEGEEEAESTAMDTSNENSETQTTPNKKGRKKKESVTVAPKKTKADKNKTKPSNSYLSLSSGPNGNPTRDKDLAICSNLLNDMSKNENSWPFADKVDEKSYPDYYELIKEPMDIQTIRNKLKNKEYENKEQFAYDCRLIFDNCEFFNEDDSAIGKAGHKLRAFFETKWFKIFD